jgi:radical SAM protein with 4Fe4S-binding SPASM domain
MNLLTEKASRLKHWVKTVSRSTQWPERPEKLNLELTSICNARCIHCPRQEMSREMEPMDLALFKKLIDEAAELKVPEIHPNGYGELTTMKNLPEYLEYISGQEHKFRIVINTNGQLMNEEKAELFFKHGIYLLNICIDGATRETAQTVRRGLKFDEIEKNIHRLLKMRTERRLSIPKIRAGFVQIDENAHEGQMFLKRWEGVADFVGLDGASSRLSSIDTGHAPAHAAPVHACTLPFDTLNIWADGKAVLCCEDWNEEHVVGDLKTQSLREVWQGERLNEVRRLHMERRGAEVEICGKCNSWRAPSPGTRLWAGPPKKTSALDG